jgi:hypothetical protein
MSERTPDRHSSDAELERFFGSMCDGFAKSAATTGAIRSELRMAERHVTLHVVGGGLSSLLRALRHLAISSSEHTPQAAAKPALEILAWESAPGWSPPKPPWKQGQQWYLGEIVGLESDRFRMNYHDQSGLFCMYDQRDRRAIFWLPDAERLPFWEIASPFRVLFHWWARTIGGHMAHAAAVGRQGRGVLLAGRSGSGKSTAAITCVDAGMEYVGDDYVLLLRDPVPTAHSLYNSAKIHTRFLNSSLPHWKGHIAGEIRPEGKSLFFLHEINPELVRSKLAICAVILPQVSGENCGKMTSMPPAQGLLALAPSTLFQLPGAGKGAMSFFSQWMRGIPVYGLKTGHDLAAGPAAVSQLLSQHSTPHSSKEHDLV